MEDFACGRGPASLARGWQRAVFCGSGRNDDRGGSERRVARWARNGPGTKPSFEAGAPQPLFEANLRPSPANNLLEYDVTADGKRFLLATVVAGETSAPPLTVVSNWTAGLKR